MIINVRKENRHSENINLEKDVFQNLEGSGGGGVEPAAPLA